VLYCIVYCTSRAIVVYSKQWPSCVLSHSFSEFRRRLSVNTGCSLTEPTHPSNCCHLVGSPALLWWLCACDLFGATVFPTVCRVVHLEIFLDNSVAWNFLHTGIFRHNKCWVVWIRLHTRDAQEHSLVKTQTQINVIQSHNLQQPIVPIQQLFTTWMFSTKHYPPPQKLN